MTYEAVWSRWKEDVSPACRSFTAVTRALINARLTSRLTRCSASISAPATVCLATRFPPVFAPIRFYHRAALKSRISSKLRVIRLWLALKICRSHGGDFLDFADRDGRAFKTNYCGTSCEHQRSAKDVRPWFDRDYTQCFKQTWLFSLVVKIQVSFLRQRILLDTPRLRVAVLMWDLFTDLRCIHANDRSALKAPRNAHESISTLVVGIFVYRYLAVIMPG